MKKCKRCGEQKMITDFYREKRNSDGLAGTCVKCWAVLAKERRKTPRAKSQKGVQMQRYYEKYPLKYKAMVALNNAVRDGRIIKTQCSGCGSVDRVQGHHEDYSKPLKVMWLCEVCHKKIHNNEHGE